jgi:anaerobic ribonucleoside-triphosphate reductase activating protein
MKTLRLSLSRLHFPITTLGPGRRIGIWTQGCSIHCEGCMSRDTWKFARGGGEAVGGVIKRILPWLGAADGVTISGGEPFDQAKALTAFLRILRTHFDGDILVYSGYPFEALQAQHAEALGHVDVVISEPFVAAKATALPLRGSDNQRFHLLTPLGRSRFKAITKAMTPTAAPALDAIIDSEGGFWLAGIPRPGDLKRLDGALRKAGVRIATSAGRMGESR